MLIMLQRMGKYNVSHPFLFAVFFYIIALFKNAAINYSNLSRLFDFRTFKSMYLKYNLIFGTFFMLFRSVYANREQKNTFLGTLLFDF